MRDVRRRRGATIGICVLSMLGSAALASPGDLDPSFGTGGVVSTNFSTFQSQSDDVVLLPDGRFVTGGSRWKGGDNDMALVRYQADGTVDPSFGASGVATASVGTASDYAQALTRQSDGKLVAAGWGTVSGTARFALARFLADGALDASFGDQGTVSTAVQSGGSEVYAVIQQTDGKIVAAGRARTNVSNFVALARYNADGTLDPGFGSGGTVAQPIGTRGGTAFAVAQQSDGKLVIAGAVTPPATSGTDIFVIRYAADGTLDATFGSGGIVTTPVAAGTGVDVATAMILQPDGKVVVGGYTAGTGGAQDLVLVRYQSNGALDAGFGSGGIVVRDLGTIEDRATALARQSDGKLLVAGYTATTLAAARFAALRFNANGTIDTGFGSGGVVTTDIVAGGFDIPAAAALQPDGRLLVVGSAYLDVQQCVAVRYTAAGALDATFGSGGVVITGVGASDDFGRAVARQSDGKLLVAGTTYANYAYQFALARYHPDGAPDGTFGNGGRVTTAPGIGGHNWFYAVTQQSDGKIVAVGHTYPTNNFNLVAMRYTAAGILDTTFNGTGYVSLAIGASTDGYAVLQQPDGKLVIAAQTWVTSGTYAFTLVRLNGTGALDSTFGTGGIVTTQLDALAGARALVRQPDGKLVAAGWSPNGSDRDFTLVRYHVNGALDASFGSGGIVRTNLGAVNERANALVLQSDGKLVAAGYSGSSTDTDFALARYDANGALDASFGSGGIVRTSFGAGLNQVAGLVVQGDGKLVASGWTPAGSDSDHALARYNADGSLDPTFGNDGTLVAALGDAGGADAASGLVLQPDGRLVTASSLTSDGDLNLGLIRFEGQVCGDGIPQSGEECDDGNRNTGDGCAANCTLEPTPTITPTATLTHTATASATAVDTVTRTATATAVDTATSTATATPEDTASGTPTRTATAEATATTTPSATVTESRTATATETATGSPSATPTETPTATPTASLCDAAPREGCRGAGAGLLLLKTSGSGKLMWKWTRGDATAAADFGDPRGATGFALCLYAQDSVLAALPIDPDPLAWRLSSHGYSYRAAAGSTAAIRQAVLRAGETTRARILLRGGAPALMPGSLPLPGPLLVAQLVNRDTGTCWESRFAPADLTRNRTDGFKARRR